MKLLRVAALSAFFALCSFAQTTISDTVYLTPGVKWSGSVTITWDAFTTADGHAIAKGSTSFPVSNGALFVKLYPTVSATPAVAYTAVYYTTTAGAYGKAWSETWNVPAIPSVVALQDVRHGSTIANGILNGSGAPSNTIGANGDFYIRTDTSCIYGPKANSAWQGSCVSMTGVSGATAPITYDPNTQLIACPTCQQSTLLTTLGDLPYRDAGGWQRLAGNTLAAKRLLCQTGTGSVSAAPVWCALAAGDIPDLSALYLPLHSTADAAANLAGGSAGQFPYQTGPGVTGFRTPNAANGPAVLDGSGNLPIGGTVLRGGGTSLPATCAIGDQYFLTTGTTGNYQCTATNTWTLPGGGTGTAPYSCSISAATSATCTHNLGTATPWVACYDGSGNMLGGSTAATSITNAVATSANALALTFSGSTTATCVISTGSMGPPGANGTNGTNGSNGANGANGAGYAATSTTSLAVGTGSVSLTTQTGLAYPVGACLQIVSAGSPTAYMAGPITAYNSGTGALTFTATALTAGACSGTGGSGTHADWNLSVIGVAGLQGPSGGGGNVNSAGSLGSGNIVMGAGSTNVQDGNVALSAVVKNNVGNTYTSGDQNFAGATSMEVPVAGGAAPTTDGGLAFDTTRNAHVAGAHGQTVSFPRVLYANWANTGNNMICTDGGTYNTLTCGNTSTSSGSPAYANMSYTIPANTLIAGKMLRVTITLLATATATPTASYYLKLGSTVVYTSAAITQGSVLNSAVTSTFILNGTTAASASALVEVGPVGAVSSSTTRNTTSGSPATNSALALTFGIGWSSSTAGNMIQIRSLLVEELN